MKKDDEYSVDSIVDEVLSGKSKRQKKASFSFDDKRFSDGKPPKTSADEAFTDEDEFGEGEYDASEELDSQIEEEDGQAEKPKRTKKKKPKKKGKGRTLKLVLIALICTVLVCTVAFFSVKFSDMMGSNISVTEASLPEGINRVEADVRVKDSGFPFFLPEEKIASLSGVGGSLCVLSDVSISLLSKTGELIDSIHHSFSEPMIKSAGGRAIVYDKTTAQYKIIGSRGELFNELISGRRIFTCAMSKSGRYAVVTDGEEAACVLTVYSADGKTHLFEWNCPTERIVCLGMSDRGDRIAAGVLTAENGQLVSKVYMLSLNMKDTPKPYVCKEGAVIGLSYVSKDDVSVITDKGRVIVSEDGKASSEVVSFSSPVGCFGYDSTGVAVMALDSFGTLGESAVYIFDKKNVQSSSLIELNDTIDSVCCSDGSAYVLSGSKLMRYSKKGEKTGETTVADAQIGFTALAGSAYCYSESTVLKYVF